MKALEIIDHYRSQIALGAGLFAVSLVLSVAAAVVVLVRLPPTYFATPEPPPFWPGRPGWVRLIGRAGKNLLGCALVALGILMSLPGVPGQGLLTILIGLVLLDVPGKRRVELRIVRVRAILRGMNRVRARFGREPLTLGPGAEMHGSTEPREGGA
ncbi:hypothetical protein E8A73_016450 [Polyangium aurulentum]|nr:hypothetical protein E8A73_016450 [Polyangium aurulentum]